MTTEAIVMQPVSAAASVTVLVDNTAVVVTPVIVGPVGPPSEAGISAGGAIGQALVKASNVDYVTTWANVVANAGAVTSMQALGQSAYDALVIKDATRLYIITGP